MKQDEVDSVLGKSCSGWEVKSKIHYEGSIEKRLYSVNKGEETFTNTPLYMINNLVCNIDEERWNYLNKNVTYKASDIIIVSYPKSGVC